MADVTLHDGRELNIDLMQINFREYEGLLNPAQTEQDGNEIIGRCVGMTADELESLPLPDYKRILKAFYKMVRQPVPDDDEKN